MFQSAAVAAVRAAGNVAMPVTYHSAGVPVYVNGAVTRTEVATLNNVKVLLTDYTLYEIAVAAGAIQRTDQKCLIPALSMQGVVPKGDDWLNQADGTEWIVLTYTIDPAGALYQIQVR